MIEYFHNKQIEHNDYKSLYILLSKSFKKLDSSVQEKMSGVYMIYNDRKQLMYIGQSKNIASRLTTHIRGKYKNAYKIDIIDLDFINNNYLDSVERFLITKLKPIDNIMVDEKYDINHLEDIFPDCENLINISTEDINSFISPSFYIFPKNKFIIRGDFMADLYELKNSLIGTEFEQIGDTL